MTPYSSMTPYQKRLLSLVAGSRVSLRIHSELAGLHHSTISNALLGRRLNPTLKVLSSLSSYFGVSIDWLVGMDMRE